MRMLFAVSLLFGGLSFGGVAVGQDLRGAGRVIDGLRLWVGATKVQLCGITSAVSPVTLGRDGRPPRKLEDFVQHKAVTCKRVGNGTPCDGRMPVVNHGHVVGQCFVDGVDVVSFLICFGNRQPEIELAGHHYHRFLRDMPGSKRECDRLR
jgi:hypothetical protein